MNTIQYHVSFVIKLFRKDSSEWIVDNRALFIINGEKVLPVIKKEGYYVFYNLSDTIIKMTIYLSGFLQKEQVIQTKTLDPKYPVVTVNLVPCKI